jgi:hypothetical protein
MATPIGHLRCLKQSVLAVEGQHACGLVADYLDKGGSDDELTTASRQGEKTTARGH